MTGGFPSQRSSYAENVSIWWRHHAVYTPHIQRRFPTFRALSCIVVIWYWSSMFLHVRAIIRFCNGLSSRLSHGIILKKRNLYDDSADTPYITFNQQKNPCLHPGIVHRFTNKTWVVILWLNVRFLIYWIHVICFKWRKFVVVLNRNIQDKI